MSNLIPFEMLSVFQKTDIISSSNNFEQFSFKSFQFLKNIWSQ